MHSFAQERHRLEMRLRELQDSANEVRNSTPPLPEPEASFIENQSLLDHNAAFLPYASSIANSQQPNILNDHLQSLEDGVEQNSHSQNLFSMLIDEPIRRVTRLTPSDPNDRSTISPQPPTPAELRASQGRSFRERLQSIYRAQSGFPSPPTSRILSQLRQRRIQRETFHRPRPYPSHLSSTYFQPRIAPYVFFPDFSAESASAEEQPTHFVGRSRSISPREAPRVLRPISSIIDPLAPLNPSRLSPADVQNEATRHRDSYTTFFAPTVHPEPASVDVGPLVSELQQIPVPDAEMVVEFEGGSSLATGPSTSTQSNSTLTRSSLLSADPMWNSESRFISEPESILIDSDRDPWSHSTLRTQSPTLLARRREQSLRRTVGTSAMLRRWLASSSESTTHTRASVIQSTSSGAIASHETHSGDTSSGSQSHTRISGKQNGPTETMTNQRLAAGNNPTNLPNSPSSSNLELPGTSEPATASIGETTLEAAHSLSDAVNSLIEAADNLNEAADNLLHDASASASVLLDDSDSSSSESVPDTQTAPSVPISLQLPPSRMASRLTPR